MVNALLALPLGALPIRELGGDKEINFSPSVALEPEIDASIISRPAFLSNQAK